VQVLRALRLAAVVLASAAAPAFDDETEPLAAASPTPLGVRRAARVLLLVVPLAAAWALLWHHAGRHVTGMPSSWPVTLEAATLLATVVSIAAVACRHGWHAGALAGPLLLVLVAGALLLPDTLTPFPEPTQQHWTGAHRNWSACLALTLIALMVASRDPGKRPVRRLRRQPR
jgi:hypothetical protein